jgi:hypothetical protein
MPDAILWQPLIGHLAIGNFDYPGAACLPLINLDRRFVHPTIYLGDEKKIKNLKTSQIHPHWRDEWLTKITGTAVRASSGKAITCTIRYTGSGFPREIYEIRMRKELAAALQASTPASFVERPIEDRYDRIVSRNYVRWMGSTTLPKDQDIVLNLPAGQPQVTNGSIVFFYRRTDGSASDFNGLFTVDLK